MNHHETQQSSDIRGLTENECLHVIGAGVGNGTGVTGQRGVGNGTGVAGRRGVGNGTGVV